MQQVQLLPYGMQLHARSKGHRKENRGKNTQTNLVESGMGTVKTSIYELWLVKAMSEKQANEPREQVSQPLNKRRQGEE